MGYSHGAGCKKSPGLGAFASKDITGEVNFVKSSADRYDEKAKEKKSLIAAWMKLRQPDVHRKWEKLRGFRTPDCLVAPVLKTCRRHATRSKAIFRKCVPCPPDLSTGFCWSLPVYEVYLDSEMQCLDLVTLFEFTRSPLISPEPEVEI